MRTGVRGLDGLAGQRVVPALFLLALGLFVPNSLVSEEIGEPGFLGVQLREETDRPGGGARVIHVVDGSPAEAAGLRRGDVVVEFEGSEIHGPLALTQRIHARRAGETVELTVIRDGAEERLEVELGRRSARGGYTVTVPPPVRVVPAPAPAPVEPPALVAPEDLPEVDAGDLPERYELKNLFENEPFFRSFEWGPKPRLGVQLVETTPELREHLGGDEEAGVLVSKILSGLPAQAAGLQVGDLIVAVDGEPVATSKELIRALADKAGRTFDVEVIRDRRPRTFEVTIPEPETDRPTGPRA